MVFVKKTRGRDKTTKICRVEIRESRGEPRSRETRVPGEGNLRLATFAHIAKDCDNRVNKPERDIKKGNTLVTKVVVVSYTKGKKPYHGRNNDDNDSDMDNMFTEVIEEDPNKQYTKNYLTSLYDDSLVMNYAESSEPFGEDNV